MDDTIAIAPEQPAGKADGPGLACVAWTDPTKLGRVHDNRLHGISGLVASWRHHEVLWAHSGRKTRARVHAVDRFGNARAAYPLPGLGEAELEAIATDAENLFVVDSRTAGGMTMLYVFAEPDPANDAGVHKVDTFVLDTPVDDPVAALFVVGDGLFGVTRSHGATELLRAALPLTAASGFERLANDGFADGEVVAADATQDGLHIAFKVKDQGVRIWSRGATESVADALQGEPCEGPGSPGKDQAIALQPGGDTYVLAPDESEHAVLQLVARTRPCPDLGEIRATGRLEAPSAVELSGLVASRAQPGVLWAHNDGGRGSDRNLLVAFTQYGQHLGDFLLPNAVNEDWEDIAIASGSPGGHDFIIVGDIGDNDLSRDEIRLLRIVEPDVTAHASGRDSVEAHEELQLRYDDGKAHNAEAFAIDPGSGDVLVLTKRNSADPDTRLYVAHAPLRDDKENLLILVASDDDAHALDARFTAADIAADGSALIAQVDDGGSWLWPRHPREPWSLVVARPPCKYDAPNVQLEAIAFDSEGGYVMVPEGKRPTVFTSTPR